MAQQHDEGDDGFVVDTRRRKARQPSPGPRVESEPSRSIPQSGPTGSPASQPVRPAARHEPVRSSTRRMPVISRVADTSTREDATSRTGARGYASAGAGSSAGRDSSRKGPTGEGGGSATRRTRRVRIRLILALIVLAIVAFLVFLVATPLHAWNGMHRDDATPGGSRPAPGKGRNYLMVGSDKREGLTADEQQRLSTGSAVDDPGQRTDSIMLIHVPDSGKPALVSIPRDSYVMIPGKGRNKINAAYSLGGRELLVETVEQATGLRIDGFLEVGFGGFASVVDSVGGVDICVPFDMDDPRAGINLKQGCQTMDGPTALGYVRARYSDPRGDLGRAERQRQFLAAIMHQAATPSTVLIPTRYWGFTHAVADGLSISNGMSMTDAADIFGAMRAVSNGDGYSTLVPVANPAYSTPAGLAVKWDADKAKALFAALRDDQPLSIR